MIYEGNDAIIFNLAARDTVWWFSFLYLRKNYLHKCKGTASLTFAVYEQTGQIISCSKYVCFYFFPAVLSPNWKQKQGGYCGSSWISLSSLHTAIGTALHCRHCTQQLYIAHRTLHTVQRTSYIVDCT